MQDTSAALKQQLAKRWWGMHLTKESCLWAATLASWKGFLVVPNKKEDCRIRRALRVPLRTFRTTSVVAVEEMDSYTEHFPPIAVLY